MRRETRKRTACATPRPLGRARTRDILVGGLASSDGLPIDPVDTPPSSTRTDRTSPQSGRRLNELLDHRERDFWRVFRNVVIGAGHHHDRLLGPDRLEHHHGAQWAGRVSTTASAARSPTRARKPPVRIPLPFAFCVCEPASPARRAAEGLHSARARNPLCDTSVRLARTWELRSVAAVSVSCPSSPPQRDDLGEHGQGGPIQQAATRLRKPRGPWSRSPHRAMGVGSPRGSGPC